MMIDVTVAKDFSGDLAAIYTHMNPLTAGARVVSASASQLVFETAGGARFVVSGTDLVWGRAQGSGEKALLGGSVEALSFGTGGQTLVRFATLQTTGAALWDAFLAERDGTDPAAVTGLLVRHCWTYEGSDLAEYFPEQVKDGFGALNPSGNDMINLYGGDDVFFTGAARDTIRGGSGNDQLFGGTENDLLVGGTGSDTLAGGDDADRLVGGAGQDVLWGGRGADTLLGGAGSDVIAGNAGDDVLTGGGQADVFVFGAASGADVITDYAVGLDHLRITSPDKVQIVARGVDCEVSFGANVIALLGVTADQITAADFVG